MSTSQFVEKFASLLKVEGEEHLAKYRVNLDILVSACAEMLNDYVIIVYSVAQVHKNSATTKGYLQFAKWLKVTYGKEPTSAEIDTIIA